MTRPPDPATDAARGEPLAASLRTLHRSVLGLLAVCAAVAVLAGPSEDTGALPPRSWTIGAVVLALGVITSRRLAASPVIGARARIHLTIATLAFAGALGLLAAGLAIRHGATQSALVFTLAAALFVLRPPAAARPGA
jgi:hypothetical protein